MERKKVPAYYMLFYIESTSRQEISDCAKTMTMNTNSDAKMRIDSECDGALVTHTEPARRDYFWFGKSGY